MIRRLALLSVGLLVSLPAYGDDTPKEVAPLPGTQPLTMEGDIASQLVDGVDRFLLRQIEESAARRAEHWKRDVSSPEAYSKSIGPNRERLRRMLGVRDARVEYDAPELVATTARPALIEERNGYRVYAVRWPVLSDPDPKRRQTVVHGEGLLLVPTDREPAADVIAIPDAFGDEQFPESLVGLSLGTAADSQFARHLAQSGCRVLVPVLVSRDAARHQRPSEAGRPDGGGAVLMNREFIYRPAFELGRHVIGYDIQKILAGVDWFEREARGRDSRIGVIGCGEGGMIALYAGAVDTRIDAVCVCGSLQPRERIWEQPIDRNVFGLLREFGDAELASMVAPRTLVVEPSETRTWEFTGPGGAPARSAPPKRDDVEREFRRAEELAGEINRGSLHFVGGEDDEVVRIGSEPALRAFLKALAPEAPLNAGGFHETKPTGFDLEARQQRQVDELNLFNQLLLRESPYVRKEFMKNLDTSSLDAYAKSVEQYRDRFREDVIGRFDVELLPPNVRTRKSWETDKWTGYEIVLDVFPDVIAYGVLLLPKDMKEGERRPVVVCQHGLEGRPTDVFLNDHPAYHDFAAKLAERGFITFAPQNLYIFTDRFRTLQRKANPLGKTLFSVIVPQHQQIVDWLQSLPYVDPDRVAFYGLSYGGKSAMRIPALVTDYCLSICSADFNEWVDKNASTRGDYSYVWTGEYEIFEWDLGSTFNYAEMAALICPRPFMVERGHFDGVGTDENVAYEFAKVRNLYQARLGIGDRCEIEWFVGPHTINGRGTFEFLHRHLDWPQPEAAGP